MNVGNLTGPTEIVAVGIVLLIATALARRTRVAPPVLLLVGGVLLSFVPVVGAVHLNPDVVLLLFLPAILFWEAISTSLREMRRNLVPIVLLSTVLVLASAAAVAVVAHLLGLAWSSAWVLGAAIAPTDATAVAALAGRLPHRDLTVLRAESLVNDGTALVIYSVAVGVAMGGGDLTPLNVSGMVLLAYGGGAAIGIAVALLGTLVRKHLPEPILETIAVALVPFAAFAAADAVGASGVLAVVVAGAVVGRVAPRVGAPEARDQSRAFWAFATFILNGALFVLVGVEVPSDVRSLGARGFAWGVLVAVVLGITLLAVRWSFLSLTRAIPRMLGRTGGARRGLYRDTLVGTVAGFRGGVSLAAALAVPLVLASGAAFPNRSSIVFIVAVVVTMSVIGQGLALPVVVRRFGPRRDEGLDAERVAARQASIDAGLRVLDERGPELAVPDDLDQAIRTELEQARLAAGAPLLDDDTVDADETADAIARRDAEHRIRREILQAKSDRLVELRDQGEIDDALAHELLSRLDIDARRNEARAREE